MSPPSVYTWPDSPLDLLTVFVPVFTIFALALLLVAHLAMNK